MKLPAPEFLGIHRDTEHQGTGTHRDTEHRGTGIHRETEHRCLPLNPQAIAFWSFCILGTPVNLDNPQELRARHRIPPPWSRAQLEACRKLRPALLNCGRPAAIRQAWKLPQPRHFFLAHCRPLCSMEVSALLDPPINYVLTSPTITCSCVNQYHLVTPHFDQGTKHLCLEAICDDLRHFTWSIPRVPQLCSASWVPTGTHHSA